MIFATVIAVFAVLISCFCVAGVLSCQDRAYALEVKAAKASSALDAMRTDILALRQETMEARKRERVRRSLPHATVSPDASSLCAKPEPEGFPYLRGADEPRRKH